MIACFAWPAAVGFAEPAPSLHLANALFEEGDWQGCALECRRVQAMAAHSDAERLLARAEANLAGARPTGFWRRVGAWPVRGMVAFYRAVVGPAIGSRCVLEPSCSRYSLEAARKHGWLGLPMTGDRLVREPAVVQAAATPVTDADGRIRFADPVEDHLGW